MRTLYLPSFIKDLKSLRGLPVYDRVKSVAFDEVPQCRHLNEISNFPKLRKSANAYRIRVGDYRIGVLQKGETLVFARVLHRKDLYRYFP